MPYDKLNDASTISLTVSLFGDETFEKQNIMNYVAGTPASNDNFLFNIYRLKRPDFRDGTFETNGQRINLRVWDIPEYPNHHNVLFLTSADCIVFVYDVTKHSTFENAKKCYKEMGISPGSRYFLVGTNSNLNYLRAIPTEEGEAFAKENNLIFFEMPSKDSHDVSKFFESIAHPFLEERGLLLSQIEAAKKLRL